MIQYRILFAVVSVSLIAQQSLARGEVGHADFSVSQLLKQEKSIALRIHGTLICQMEAENNGTPCELKIRDEQSGQSYNLKVSAEIMEMYYSGNRKVSLDAKVLSDGSLEVTNVKKL